MRKAYTLHVVERGQGPPVILLHGIMSTHRYWLAVAKLLESKHRVLMPDMLGFGKSPKPHKAAYSLDQYVACLEQTFGAYRFKTPPVLVGHSMGALIALHWAVKCPEKFSKLILCSPVFFDEPLLYQQLATIPLEGRLVTSKLLAKSISAAMGFSGFVPSMLATRLVRSWPKHIIEDATRHHYYVYRKLLRNTHFKDEVLADLRQLKLPVKLLIGERDLASHHALDSVKKICDTNKRCWTQVLPAGHQLPIEYPKTVADVIVSV